MNTPYDNKKSTVSRTENKIIVPTFENAERTFNGVRFDVHTIKLPGTKGNFVRRDVVVHPGAVIILPFLDKDHLVMIRNERFAVGQELWELPAGTLEPKEYPVETAKRELIEETGYQAHHIERITWFYTSPGFCNEVMYAYVAKELIHVGQALDESEKIKVEAISLKNALAMARNGTITDGKTLATLLFYNTFYL